MTYSATNLRPLLQIQPAYLIIKKKVCSVEIIKQLYDIARLFGRIDNLEVTAKSFRQIVEVEMAYRDIDDLDAVFDDILQTSILIATRGERRDWAV